MQPSPLHSGLFLLPSWIWHCHAGQGVMIYLLQRGLLPASRSWDGARAAFVADRLLEGAANDEERASFPLFLPKSWEPG